MLVDSKEQMIDPMEIVKTALAETKSQYTIDQGVAAVMAESQTPNTMILREGNTLFIINYNPKDKSRGMFRALNADTAKNYLENSKTFIRAAGMIGFKILVVRFQDPTILNIFRYIYRDPPFPGMGYSVQHDKKKNMYQVTINMGAASATTGAVAPEGAVP
jgi:hypothetical protein